VCQKWRSKWTVTQFSQWWLARWCVTTFEHKLAMSTR